ncbi:BgTH12-01560 [Blumeria graminis f. sp. triticale]|nr:BgTH12-01560 [Blumeria graminis f. sp. triticale]
MSIMWKKQTGLLITCGCSRHPLHSRGMNSKASLLSPQTKSQQQHYRLYATSSVHHNKHDRNTLHWPETTSANKLPTPYEIFNQKKYMPYSKQRFYELVKLYHPDRHSLDTKVRGLSRETKLERYRLVIAANNILVDPIRRSAYDRYGAGWNGQIEPPQRDNWDSGPNSTSSDGGWNGGPSGPHQNATWEDWERWHARDGSQNPNLVSNAAFVGIILVFAFLGGLGQASRAGSFSINFLEQRDALHHRISKELTQTKKESVGYHFQEERIQKFMKSRDPYGHNTNDVREINLKQLLESPDICSNRDYQGRRDNYNKNNDP